MDHATRTAIAGVETKLLDECDGAESFCSMLEGWLDQHKHWLRNELAADLINGIRDEISDTKAAIEKARASAAQDAHDTAGDHKREAA